MAKVGFVGLGVMGAPMAGHLLSAGHSVNVWSRSPGKCDGLAAQGAHTAGSLAELAARSDTVFLCVNRTEDVEQCLDGMRDARPGTLFVDHSTISPDGARSIHETLGAREHLFMDAPITGGSMGALQGTLTVFCGGDRDVFDRAKPVMAAYAKRSELVGGPGAGQTMKAANQIAVGGALLALCESLAFAARSGLDLALTRELLAGGAAGSWAMDNYGPKIISQDWSPGFSIKNQRKDFAYARSCAAASGARIPGTELVDGLLAELESAGFGEQTTAALYRVLAGDS